jgi:lipopolysaccharide transport system permease protein
MEAAREKLNNYYWAVEWNPIAHIIESYRSLWFDTHPVYWTGIIVALIAGFIAFTVGLIIFNKTEKTFIDTV